MSRPIPASHDTALSPVPERAAPSTSRPRVNFTAIPARQGHRIVLYGPGGIGKTSTAALAPGPVGFFDLDDSLACLQPNFEQLKLDIRPVDGVTNWQALLESLRAEGWDPIRTIVIDSITRAEELAVAYTLATVLNEKKQKVERLEDYGYGKGYSHVYDVFLPLLAELDRHMRAGRNVILICHDCTSTVPNPTGEDWLRYEPRLQSPGSGKASIRLRVREWADHVLFLGYERQVKSDGTVTDMPMSRTIWPVERPHCMAKSRVLSKTLPMGLNDDSVWRMIFNPAA